MSRNDFYALLIAAIAFALVFSLASCGRYDDVEVYPSQEVQLPSGVLVDDFTRDGVRCLVFESHASAISSSCDWSHR